MTNEEFVVLIQNGEREKLPELWAQVERFVSMLADKQALTLRGIGSVEPEDLYQSGYIALVAAADSYNPSAGRSFVGWLALHLKNSFAEAGGYRSRKQTRDPLHLAGSLDIPVGDESDTTIGGLIADPESIQGFHDVEDRVYQEQLHAALDRALGTLPVRLAEVVRDKYYRGRTVDQKSHSAAMRALRRPQIRQELQRFL